MYTTWKIIENTTGLNIHMRSLTNALRHNAYVYCTVTRWLLLTPAFLSNWSGYYGNESSLMQC